MKGLLLKDVYLLWKYCKAILMIVVVFAAIAFVGDSNFFFVAYPGIITGMLPMTLFSYDEIEKFCPYSATLPVSRAQYVSAKYLIGLMVSGGTVCIIALSQVIRVLMSDGHWSDFWPMLFFLAGMSILAPAVMLPFAFKFGTQKGRLIYYAVIGGTCAASFLVTDSGAFSGGNGGNMAVFFSAAAVLYALSWLLSIRFYKKREL